MRKINYLIIISTAIFLFSSCGYTIDKSKIYGSWIFSLSEDIGDYTLIVIEEPTFRSDFTCKYSITHTLKKGEKETTETSNAETKWSFDGKNLNEQVLSTTKPSLTGSDELKHFFNGLDKVPLKPGDTITGEVLELTETSFRIFNPKENTITHFRRNIANK